MDSPSLGPPELPQVVHEAPFFQEHLGELQPHHCLSELGPGPDQLLLLAVSTSLFEPGLGPREERTPPLLYGLRRNLDLTADLAKVLASHETKDDLRFALRAPAFG